jgi:23S rRNA pseudouridine2605 synthase
MSSETQASGKKPDRAKAGPKAGKSAVKAKTASAKSKAPSAKKISPASKTKIKTPATKAGKPQAKQAAKPAKGYGTGDSLIDPIGAVSSGEARLAAGEPLAPGSDAGMAAYRAETEVEAVGGTLESASESSGASAEAEPAAGAHLEAEPSAGNGSQADEDEAGTGEGPQPAAKLERLQKILSQAGVASRRRAEEMIVAGQVMVNGQVVTQLGSKADPTRDHIRVDGKLLHGAERHRYFLLNKPKGYVTTVSDPQGRPTVMEFFAKMRERLYPVGRLDYQSEGLILITNDGELANRLSKAGSGVEKTYLVKVAGRPSEEELNRLRGGVAIERGPAGSPKVRTAPARIRQIREGGNPWYEVVLIEGRNRELRKMFAAIGHFVEKIRRVGYGPLTLDLGPGEFRELTAEEVAALRLMAEGKFTPRLRMETGARAAGIGARRPKPAKFPPHESGYAARQRFAQQPPAREGKQRPMKPAPRERDAWKPRGGRFGPRPGARGPENERPAGKPGRFGARPQERRPFRDQPEFGPEPRARFEQRRFAGRPRPVDQDAGLEESPRKAFHPRGPARGSGRGPERGPERGFARNFERPARPAKPYGQPPAKPFGKGSGKSRAGKPQPGWKQTANQPSGRREGSAPAFRGQGNRGTAARRSGPRPSGKPWNGKRRG